MSTLPRWDADPTTCVTHACRRGSMGEWHPLRSPNGPGTASRSCCAPTSAASTASTTSPSGGSWKPSKTRHAMTKSSAPHSLMVIRNRNKRRRAGRPDNGPLSRPPDGGARALGDGRNRCFNPGAPCLLRPGFRSLPWLPLAGATDLPHTPCAMSNPSDTAVAEVPGLLGRPSAVTQPPRYFAARRSFGSTGPWPAAARMVSVRTASMMWSGAPAWPWSRRVTRGAGKNGARNRLWPPSLLTTCTGVMVTITDRMAA